MNKLEIEEKEKEMQTKTKMQQEVPNNIQANASSGEQKLSGLRRNQGLITILVLVSMNLLNNSDRYIISSVLTDIESFFGISKSTAGLLQTVYLVCYMAASPFTGYLGDRIDRKWLLLTGLLVWGASTVLGSLCSADQFGLFVASRCFFGIATGIFGPIGVPILGDRFANNEVTYQKS